MTIKRVGIDARMVSQNPTGVGNYIAELLRPMCKTHAETEFILYSNSIIDFSGIKNITIREGGAKIGPVWLNTDLVRALKRDSIDVFWGANGVAPLFSNVPTVVTVHDLVYRFAGHTMGFGARLTKKAFQIWSVRRARRVIAVSNATAVDVHRVYGRPVDDVIIPIPQSAFKRRSHEEIQASIAYHDLPQRYWLSAGTLEPRKNLVALLTAYLHCLDSGLNLPILVLAGNAGWASEKLNRLIQRGESLGKVKRLGYVELNDLACLYAGSELLWMPSIYEGFGMPLLEAQRCGAPVAHGDHASMVEASGGLGITTATGEADLVSTMKALAQGEAPLACRLEQAEEGEGRRASERLWDNFCSAAIPASSGNKARI